MDGFDLWTLESRPFGYLRLRPAVYLWALPGVGAAGDASGMPAGGDIVAGGDILAGGDMLAAGDMLAGGDTVGRGAIIAGCALAGIAAGAIKG